MFSNSPLDVIQYLVFSNTGQLGTNLLLSSVIPKIKCCRNNTKKQKTHAISEKSHGLHTDVMFHTFLTYDGCV